LANDLTVASTEVVAEYAADLKFGLTVVSDAANGALTYLPEDHADIPKFAGLTYGAAANASGYGPHLIRGIHARLVIRNKEPDRGVPIVSGGNPDELFRIQVAAGEYSRARTLRSHVATRNTGNALWQ
jgi:hypothetical protein